MNRGFDMAISIRHGLLAVAAFLLAACTTNVSRDYRLDPQKAEGLVVGSISYESGIGRFVLEAKGRGASKRYDMQFGCPVWPCMGSDNDADFSRDQAPKQRGGGFAVAMPEGDYIIVGWRVEQGQMVSRSTQAIGIPFRVESGKALYLGNLHFDAHWEDVRLRDRADHDLPLLQARFPALAAAPVSSTITPGVSIELGGEHDRGLEGMFVPLR